MTEVCHVYNCTILVVQEYSTLQCGIQEKVASPSQLWYRLQPVQIRTYAGLQERFQKLKRFSLEMECQETVKPVQPSVEQSALFTTW